jgi:hypothetical protein
MNIGGVIAMASWLSACMALPQEDIVSPALSGIVHRSGAPVENALVSLEVSRGDACSSMSGESTRTDRQGRFHFAARNEPTFRFLPSMGPSNRFQVCIADGLVRHQGWYERKQRGVDDTLTLDCNIQSPLPVYQHTPNGQVMGICRAASALR